jgi:hypothetical protein
MYVEPYDLDEQYAAGFYRTAPSLGLNPNVLGARLDMRAEKKLNGDTRIPDFMYFRGHLPGKGEFSFALSGDNHANLRGGSDSGVRNVAWRYIERVLSQPGNTHLLEASHILEDLTGDEFSEKLASVSAESGLPAHVRELLVEAARRLDQASKADSVLDTIRKPAR